MLVHLVNYSNMRMTLLSASPYLEMKMYWTSPATCLSFMIFWICSGLNCDLSKCARYLFTSSWSTYSADCSFDNAEPLTRVDSAKNLGIIINNNIRWASEISKCAKPLEDNRFTWKDSGVFRLKQNYRLICLPVFFSHTSLLCPYCFCWFTKEKRQNSSLWFATYQKCYIPPKELYTKLCDAHLSACETFAQNSLGFFPCLT